MCVTLVSESYSRALRVQTFLKVHQTCFLSGQNGTMYLQKAFLSLICFSPHYLLFPTFSNSLFTKHAFYIFQMMWNCPDCAFKRPHCYLCTTLCSCVCAQGRTKLEASIVSSSEGEMNGSKSNHRTFPNGVSRDVTVFVSSFSLSQALCQSGLCLCHCLSLSVWNCCRDRSFFVDYSVLQGFNRWRFSLLFLSLSNCCIQFRPV